MRIKKKKVLVKIEVEIDKPSYDDVESYIEKIKAAKCKAMDLVPKPVHFDHHTYIDGNEGFEWGDPTYDITVCATCNRWETDAEGERRAKRSKAAKMGAAKRKAEKTDHERAEYERLAKIYGEEKS